jgi:FkbM family methyltransferase
MLIPFSECVEILRERGLNVTGILHVGAHECEEFRHYLSHGILPEQMYWLEANNKKVEECKRRGIPNVYCQAIDNKVGEEVFYVTNNGQSSSLLELGSHAIVYPHIVVTESYKVNVNTLKNWIETNSIPIETCSFWNLDIQGKELDALKSAGEYIKHANAIYTEVNTGEVYKGCALLPEIDEFLKTYGFTRIKSDICKEEWGDALYVKTEF